MAMPRFEDFLKPVLEIVANLRSVESARTALVPIVAERMHLSEEDCRQRLPSGGITTLRSRVGWSLTYLKKAGLIESSRRGQFAITERGSSFLAANAIGFGVKDLKQFSEFAVFSATGPRPRLVADYEEEAPESLDPDDRISAALAEINAAVSEDLLEILGQTNPTSFEHVV